MMTDRLFFLLLILALVWLILFSIFLGYQLLRFIRRGEHGCLHPERRKPEGVQSMALEPHSLVAKSKPFIAQGFLPLPETSLPPKEMDNTPTFAHGASAKTDEQESTAHDLEQDNEGDENELMVERPADEVDEDEVLREELILVHEPLPEVSPTAILSRDLARLSSWATREKNLDDTPEDEAVETLSRIRGSILEEKFLECMAEHGQKLEKLQATMSRCGQPQAATPLATLPEESEDGKPLSYYLR